MKLPAARGPISQELFEALPGTVGRLPAGLTDLVRSDPEPDARVSEDIQICLFVCYGLHYDGFDDVDEHWEWDPALLAVRAALEVAFEDALLSSVTAPTPATIRRGPPAPPVGERGALSASDLPVHLLEMASPAHGSAMDAFAHKTASIEQFRELVTHRSIKNLREGDQHTWAIPRITGRAKSALITIQADEYGGGRPGWTHAELYAQMMRGLDLDPTYGAYINQIPAVSVAAVNIMSLYGLHRRWRAALLGNLAVIEIGSSIANRRYSEGLARVGASAAARAFYDEHIEADAVHEQIAAHDMCGALAQEHPEQLETILFGATSTMSLRSLYGTAVLQAFTQGRTSLLATTTAA
ncbi:iron-containing redox enzyme family protein [Kineosporia sp. NBRC 101731]|uniref:iron-containing redox enzyme family protein n=1 Tax=Kineosporia sp. NBRC 101731 TaxID=3032199 RepID=UPI0024A2ABA7|nr:iron-containing redox enzyme family protein [Kineosporia sp. NBRC 101731]GLY33452.1 hypothetical protein Kisp02_68170 [Kineosporia sp. NBRC 101731]